MRLREKKEKKWRLGQLRASNPHPPRTLHNRRERRTWSSSTKYRLDPRRMSGHDAEILPLWKINTPMTRREAPLFLIISFKRQNLILPWIKTIGTIIFSRRLTKPTNDILIRAPYTFELEFLWLIFSQFYRNSKLDESSFERDRPIKSVSSLFAWSTERQSRCGAFACEGSGAVNPSAHGKEEGRRTGTRYTRVHAIWSGIVNTIFSHVRGYTRRGRKSRRCVCRFTPARHYLRPVQARPN